MGYFHVPPVPSRELAPDVSARIAAALERGRVPWARAYSGEPGPPVSGATGQPLYGVNASLLGLTASARGFSSREWFTYNEIRTFGGTVRPEELSRGTRVVTAQGSAVLYNRAQAQRLPLQDRATVQIGAEDRAAAAAAVVDTLGVGLRTVPDATRDHYDPGLDEIQMRPPEAFASADAYSAALLHQAGRASLPDATIPEATAPSPDREAETALAAEMAGAAACTEIGIPSEVQQPEMVARWVRLLRQDPEAFGRAATVAHVAAERLRAREHAAEIGGDSRAYEDAGTAGPAWDPHALASLNPLQAAWALEGARARGEEPPRPVHNVGAALASGDAADRHQALAWLLIEADGAIARAEPSTAPPARQALVAAYVAAVCRTEAPADVEQRLGVVLRAPASIAGEALSSGSVGPHAHTGSGDGAGLDARTAEPRTRGNR